MNQLLISLIFPLKFFVFQVFAGEKDDLKVYGEILNSLQILNTDETEKCGMYNNEYLFR